MRKNKKKINWHDPATFNTAAIILVVLGVFSLPAGGSALVLLGVALAIVARRMKKRGGPGEQRADSGVLVKDDFAVAGIYYRLNSIEALRRENPKWTDLPGPGDKPITIYRYKFKLKPVQLVPEPENEHDPDAIKVMVAGQHLGYISASETEQVRQILRTRSIKYISVWIRGGEQKTIYPDGEIKFDVHDYSASVRIAHS